MPTYPIDRSRLQSLAAALALLLLLGVALLSSLSWTHRGLAMALLLVLAVPLITPWVVDGMARPLRPVRLGVAYALKTLTHRIASAGVAVAGLAIAVSMMVGITVMVWSFRTSLSDWIETTVQADIYVSAAAWRGDADAPGLPARASERLRGLDGVAVVDNVRGFSGRAAGRPVALRGVHIDLPGAPARFHILSSVSGDRPPDGVFISEPLARKAGLAPGERIPLETPSGTVDAVVTAVLRDYGNERGAVTMDLGQMERWFGAGDPHGAAVYLEPDASLGAKLAEIQETLSGYGLSIRSNRSLRENALAVFDQTFRITLILQAMALLIATVGVTLTLFVLGYDEAGTLALYRALGATRRQVFRFFVAKGLAIAVAGTLIGLVAGGALAWILIFVTNPSYFGWSLDPHVPAGQLLRQAGWILLAAAVASTYPAFLASRPRTRALNPIEA